MGKHCWIPEKISSRDIQEARPCWNCVLICQPAVPCGWPALRQERTEGLGFVLSRTEDGGNVTSTTVIGFDDGKAPAGEEIHQIQRAQRRQAALEREAIPLGGSPSDVLVLSLGLDMGDIREPLGADRWDLLRRWCDGDDETTDRDWQRNLEAAERLRSCGSRDAVRIWVDHTPYGACGLLHAASLLKDTKADVRVVFLPPWRERPDGVVETYLGWGEVEPELFGRFLSRRSRCRR